MITALQRRGLHGTGLTELLAMADAPKGVLYHHFPGGKNELAVAAVHASVDSMCALLAQRLHGAKDPAEALLAWMHGAQARLHKSGYELGCPLAAIALETTTEDVDIRAALHAGFARLRESISAALSDAGYDSAIAASLASLIVAAYEGGLLQARAAGSPEPMRLVGQALFSLVKLHRPEGGNT